MALFYAAPSVKKHIDFSESECGTTQYGQQNIHSASWQWRHDSFIFYGNMIEILSLATC